jgi:hypothetical protein
VQQGGGNVSSFFANTVWRSRGKDIVPQVDGFGRNEA